MKKLFSCCYQHKKKLSIDSETSAKRKSSFITGPKIIIVGAGVAGLACAVKLIDSGINDVKIIEAEGRIGGRVHTVPFGSNFVDMGAQWVHGKKDNVVYEMVKNMDLLETSGDAYVSFQCIRSNGEIVPELYVEQMKDVLADIFINQRNQMSDFDGSFGEFLQRKFFEIMSDPGYEHIDSVIVSEFFENFKKMESSESSLGLDEVSARGFLEYWDCEGDYMLNWKDKGFKEFLRVLTRAEPGSDTLGILRKKLLLNTRVEKIMWNQDDGTVSVLCEDNSEPLVADNVVITVSLGVLKKFARDMFEPQLPPQKMIAIKGIGFGDVLKVFIEFPYKFWPSQWTGFTTLWRLVDLEELNLKNLLWIREIYGFYPVSNQPLVLEAWAVGATVTYIECLPRNELQIHLMNILQRFLKNWKIPEPKSILSTSWSTNRNFCGAYSFRTLQTELLHTGATALAQPVDTLLSVGEPSEEEDSSSLRDTIKPTLLFAGEATSSHYFSTVHGAVESGFREAKRLAGFYDSQT